MMPDQDGWDVLASIKNNEKWKHIPVVFLTAKTDDTSKGIGSLTSEGYITKPFEIGTLKQKINENNDNINKYQDEDNEDMIVYWCEKAIDDLYSGINELKDYQISDELSICRNYSIKGYNNLFDGYRDLINGYRGNPEYFISAQENFAKFSSYYNSASYCYEDL